MPEPEPRTSEAPVEPPNGSDDETPHTLSPPPRGGWYATGVGVQLLLWVLVFLGLALAVLGDNALTEFRYVGF